MLRRTIPSRLLRSSTATATAAATSFCASARATALPAAAVASSGCAATSTSVVQQYRFHSSGSSNDKNTNVIPAGHTDPPLPTDAHADAVTAAVADRLPPANAPPPHIDLNSPVLNALLNVTTVDEKAVADVLTEHSLFLDDRDHLVNIVGYLASFKRRGKESDAREDIAYVLQKARQLSTNPEFEMRSSAKPIMGRRVFLSPTDYKNLHGRKVGGDFNKRIVETYALYQLVDKSQYSNKTVVVSGPSGSGKTMALMGLSQEGTSIVVYGTPVNIEGVSDAVADFKNPTNCELNIGNDPKAVLEAMSCMEQSSRNDLMTLVLKHHVLKVMGNAIGFLKQLHDGFTLYVALDEMGGYAGAVRALCALGSAVGQEALRVALGLGDKTKVRIVTAGTGIGTDDNPPGSSNDTFEEVRVGTDNENLRVFAEYFNGKWAKITQISTIEALIDDPYVIELIKGNARLAAILGEMAKNSTTSFVGSSEAKLRFLDLSKFVSAAAFEFKKKNGLEHLRLDELGEVLVRAVRLHQYADVDTDADALLVKYGLLVDNARWRVKSEIDQSNWTMLKEEKVRRREWTGLGKVKVKNVAWQLGLTGRKGIINRYSLPAFSVMVLSLLMGRETVVPSSVSGAELEGHWLLVSHLLACAAGNAELFRALLSNKLVPLPLKDNGKEAALQRDTNITKGAVLKPCYDIVIDCTKTVADEVKSAITVPEGLPRGGLRLLECADDAIGSASMKEDGTQKYRVASFATPYKMRFADSGTIIDDALFLFQAKDYAKNKSIKFHLERWKMGAIDDDAITAFLKDKKLEKEAKHLTTRAKDEGKTLFEVLSTLGDSSQSSTTASEQVAEDLANDASVKKQALLELLPTLKPTVTDVDQKKKEKKMNETLHDVFGECLQPLIMLGGLVELWRQRTGIVVASLQLVFVTPTAISPKDLPSDFEAKNAKDTQLPNGGPKLKLHKTAFVSVDEISFLKFTRDAKPKFVSFNNSIQRKRGPVTGSSSGEKN